MTLAAGHIATLSGHPYLKTSIGKAVSFVVARFTRMPSQAPDELPGRALALIRAGLIMLTVNEFRRLFDALLLVTKHTVTSLLASPTRRTPVAFRHGQDRHLR